MSATSRRRSRCSTSLRPARPPSPASYDADHLRSALRAKGGRPVIPDRSNRKNRPYDEIPCRERWIEAVFWRLKDFRRLATRYDRLAANFTSAVAVVIIIAF